MNKNNQPRPADKRAMTKTGGMNMNDRQQKRRSVPARPAVEAPPEPSVRRWPHPVCGTEATAQSESSMHYVCCALSYQNQLLADIKALLEKLAAQCGE